MNENLFLTKASMPSRKEFFDEIKDCWETHWITTMGPKHQQLEKQLVDFLSVKNILLFSSGHCALELLLQAMALEGEIITTPFTFASTTHAIVRNGLIPRFCDIKESDYTLDETKIERLINEKTVAILPVHVFGNICNVNAIDKIAKKYGLKVIYDAAHAFGESMEGRNIASFGDASMFSFHASKVFNTIEGGAAIVQDDLINERLKKLRFFGVGENEYVELIGANGKMNEFQAAMGICNLRHFWEEVEKRSEIDAYYRKRLGGIDGIKLNMISQGLRYNYSYFPILIDEKKVKCSRDQLYNLMHNKKIWARKHFYQLANTYPCYPKACFNDTTPVAEYVSRRILSLPLYADMKKSDVDNVCEVILSEINI